MQSQKSLQLSRDSRPCFTLRSSQELVDLAIPVSALASGMLHFGMYHIDYALLLQHFIITSNLIISLKWNWNQNLWHPCSVTGLTEQFRHQGTTGTLLEKYTGTRAIGRSEVRSCWKNDSGVEWLMRKGPLSGYLPVIYTGDHCIGHTALCSTGRVALRLRRSWPPL